MDLLAVDAEGLDADIIMSLDFNILRPRVIFFEHHTLGDKYESLLGFFAANNYSVRKLGVWDAVAELTKAGSIIKCNTPREDKVLR